MIKKLIGALTFRPQDTFETINGNILFMISFAIGREIRAPRATI